MEKTYELKQFRQQVYQNFNKRADVLMDLVDALSSNTNAHTVVELSLNPNFRRDYSSMYKAIASCQIETSRLAKLAGAHLPQPQKQPFWLFGVDVTPQERAYARTLEDREFVYQANPIKGKKPIVIGHKYSEVACLPEKGEGRTSPWVVPLANRRVKSDEDKEMVGAEQIAALLCDERMPFHGELCVEVGDTSYSKAEYLVANRSHSNLVTIARVRSNRTFYRQPEEGKGSSSTAGHPTWYGQPFKLPDPSTWHTPDETLTTTHVSRRGRQYRVEIKAWRNMLMRGKQKPYPIPMHKYPFTLIQVCLYNDKGKLAFRRPLWLIVIGKRRHELGLSDSYPAYRQRFDIEHFFRFGKQKLLIDKFQTPETKHEETWWQLCNLAYLQLWVARTCARCLPRPWEHSLPAVKSKNISPSFVQRDFSRIIRQLGTPASWPKPRGYSPGRPKGLRLAPRQRQSVVRKTQTQPKSA